MNDRADFDETAIGLFCDINEYSFMCIIFLFFCWIVTYRHARIVLKTENDQFSCKSNTLLLLITCNQTFDIAFLCCLHLKSNYDLRNYLFKFTKLM